MCRYNRRDYPNVWNIIRDLNSDIKVYLSKLPEYDDPNKYLGLLVRAGSGFKAVYGTIERYETDEYGCKWYYVREQDSLMYSKWSIDDLSLVELYNKIIN